MNPLLFPLCELLIRDGNILNSMRKLSQRLYSCPECGL